MPGATSAASSCTSTERAADRERAVMSIGIERAGHSFADQAEVALRQQILSGHRAPGDRLNEVEIAAELGVSRGPLREAMQRLARDGLVVVQPHRGSFVRSLEPDEIAELFE